jgi:hypothetical protein
MGRFAIGILTLLAELELERIKENWESAVRSAIERGVHVSGRTPTGYRRDKSGRLLRDEPAASFVAEAFRRRALGASWAELARFLEENDVYPPTGNKHWSKPGVSRLVRNRVYLGEARSGAIVNRNAHEPIVTQAEFDAAQVGRTLYKQPDGSVASKALLGGLVRCAGCGHTLKIAGNRDKKTGESYPVYYCTGRYAKGLCPARATVRASTLDAYVEEQVLRALGEEGGFLAQAVRASEEIEEAARRVAEAEHEFDLFVLNPKLLTLLGESKFLEGVEVRQRALDEARREFGDLRAQSLLADELPSGDLLAAWPGLETQEKRKLLHGLLDRVVLRRAPSRGPGSVPIADRTQIVLRGNVLLEPEQRERRKPAARTRKSSRAARSG